MGGRLDCGSTAVDDFHRSLGFRQTERELAPGVAGVVPAAGLRPRGVIAWLVTVDRMRGRDMGPGAGRGGLGCFAGIWAVMMAAMMLPSLVPMAGAYSERARAAPDIGARRAFMQTTLFVG